jgi:hypothetical protein
MLLLVVVGQTPVLVRVHPRKHPCYCSHQINIQLL